MTRLSPAEFKSRYGQWALVAGASEGLGEAFAEQIAQAGLNIAIVARREAALNTLRDRLTSAYGVEVRAIPLDLAREEAASTLAEALADVQVGLLVYNAALSVIGPFLDRPLDDHLAEIAINCRAPMGLAYHFGQPMRTRGRGGIVLMSSLSALQGTVNVANYTATKAFNMILAEGLWEELRGNGVDVLACSPGAVSTPSYIASLTGSPSKGSPAGAMTPQAVAAETLAALGKQGSFFPGFNNKAVAFFMRRIMPHRLAVVMVGRVLRQMYGS